MDAVLATSREQISRKECIVNALGRTRANASLKKTKDSAKRINSQVKYSNLVIYGV